MINKVAKKITHFDILNSTDYNKNQQIKTNLDFDKMSIIKKLCNKLFGVPNTYNLYICETKSEMYNLAIYPIIKAFSSVANVPHIICGNIDDPMLLDIVANFSKLKLATVSFANVDIQGELTLDEIKRHIRVNTCLIIAPVNNYLTGAANNIKLISELAHSRRIPLFSNTINIICKQSISSNIDIFTAALATPSVTLGTSCTLLMIKKTLFTGFQLERHSELFKKPQAVTDKVYKSLIQTLDNCLYQKNKNINSTSNNILYLTNLLQKSLNKTSNKLYTYDNIIKSNIIPETGDIILLGPFSGQSVSMGQSLVVSFIYMSKLNSSTIGARLKSNGILIYKHSVDEIRQFEKLGILEKWTKKIITITLEFANKTDINKFVKLLVA